MAQNTMNAEAAVHSEVWKQTLSERLLESALVGAHYGYLTKSEQIIDSVKEFRPEKKGPLVIGALSRLHAGYIDDAITMLRDTVLAKYPDYSTAKGFLAVAYRMAVHEQEFLKLSNELISESSDAPIAEIVRVLKAEKTS